MNKLSLIVLLIIGWFSLATYWYVCEIGDFCGSEREQQASAPIENLSTSAEAEQAQRADTDGDGLRDVEEDANGNGQLDPGETDPNDEDTDGDGFNDKVELDAGTDPLDITSTPAEPETNTTAEEEATTEPEEEQTETATVEPFSDDVFFQPDSSQLTTDPANDTVITDAVQFAQDNPTATITLTGFTASLTSEVVSSDEELARQRAETVQQEMVSQGVDTSRITIDAQGDTSAASPEQARRVTIQIQVGGAQ